jgi:hypothetical protein
VANELWPKLSIAEWQDTRDTLHMITQMIGKVRLCLCARQNHYWHVTLLPSPRGLATPPIPFGSRVLEMRLDLVGHELVLETSGGERHAIPLRSAPIAELYRELVAALRVLGVEQCFSTLPSEVEHPIRFERDWTHVTYEPSSARRFGAMLVQASRVLERFRAEFLGKSSPVHFFWGGFDLAITRFSGRRAPAHPPVPFTPLEVVREAYSHEVMSVGFWPGAGAVDACFYAYAYPEPAGFPNAKVRPRAARYEATLGEWLLPYEAVRTARDPDVAVLAFARSAYEAAADLAHWDRAALERRADAPPPRPSRPSRPSAPSRHSLSDAGAAR